MIRREHLRDSAERPFINEERVDWPLWFFVVGATGLFLMALAQWVGR